MNHKKKACIAFANGCLRAEAEIALFADYLTANGYLLKEQPEDVDIVLVSACGFDVAAETIAIRMLSGLVRKVEPWTKLAIIGCLPGINPAILKERFGKRVVPVAPNSLETLDRLIGADVSIAAIRNSADQPRSHVRGSVSFSPDFLPGRITEPFESAHVSRKAFSLLQRAVADLPSHRDIFDKWISRVFGIGDLLHFGKPEPWIPGIIVARGCRGACTYCAIKNASGPLVSTPLASVIQQAERLFKNEQQRITSLVAGDLGAYGQDIGTNICELLEGIFEIDGEFKIILGDFNPEWLIKYSERLRAILAKYHDKVDHLKLPVQSGSDGILRKMGRKYTRAELLEHVNALNRDVPDLPVSTHVMVGFPGESDEDFKQTLSLLDVLHFKYVTVFKYSERPGTEAVAFPNKVPESIKRRRLRLMRKKALTRGCSLCRVA